MVTSDVYRKFNVGAIHECASVSAHVFMKQEQKQEDTFVEEKKGYGKIIYFQELLCHMPRYESIGISLLSAWALTIISAIL